MPMRNYTNDPGNERDITNVRLVDGAGVYVGPESQNIYQLATLATGAVGVPTAPVSGILGGSYMWDVQGTFAGGGVITLQFLKSDGVTWATAKTPAGVDAAMTASGVMGVVMGSNASVRLMPTVANTTVLSSNLS